MNFSYNHMDLYQESLVNETIYKGKVTTFFFLAFSSSVTYNLLLFTLVLLIYIVTICGNFLIIMLVYYSKSLHSPMYFFLSHLSVSDIMLITDIAPNMLSIILHERTPMSFSCCIAQYYVFVVIDTFECYLLTVMSYDRYLAICSPLHYVSIMKPTLCSTLVLISWMLGCSLAVISTVSICQLQFCGPNVIDHIYCDLGPLLELSCSDVSTVQTEIIFIGIPIVILPFLVILVSYMYIVLTIIKIPSYSGRLKSFSTCSSHLTVVLIFYGTLFVTYLIPNQGQSPMVRKIISMFYTVLTPFLNPFIYSLKNQDIKNILKKSLKIIG